MSFNSNYRRKIGEHFIYEGSTSYVWLFENQQLSFAIVYEKSIIIETSVLANRLSREYDVVQEPLGILKSIEFPRRNYPAPNLSIFPRSYADIILCDIGSIHSRAHEGQDRQVDYCDDREWTSSVL